MSKYVPPGKASAPAPSISRPRAGLVQVYAVDGKPLRLLCVPVTR